MVTFGIRPALTPIGLGIKVLQHRCPVHSASGYRPRATRFGLLATGYGRSAATGFRGSVFNGRTLPIASPSRSACSSEKLRSSAIWAMRQSALLRTVRGVRRPRSARLESGSARAHSVSALRQASRRGCARRSHTPANARKSPRRSLRCRYASSGCDHPACAARRPPRRSSRARRLA